MTLILFACTIVSMPENDSIITTAYIKSDSECDDDSKITNTSTKSADSSKITGISPIFSIEKIWNILLKRDGLSPEELNILQSAQVHYRNKLIALRKAIMCELHMHKLIMQNIPSYSVKELASYETDQELKQQINDLADGKSHEYPPIHNFKFLIDLYKDTKKTYQLLLNKTTQA